MESQNGDRRGNFYELDPNQPTRGSIFWCESNVISDGARITAMGTKSDEALGLVSHLSRLSLSSMAKLAHSLICSRAN